MVMVQTTAGISPCEPDRSYITEIISAKIVSFNALILSEKFGREKMFLAVSLPLIQSMPTISNAANSRSGFLQKLTSNYRLPQTLEFTTTQAINYFFIKFLNKLSKYS